MKVHQTILTVLLVFTSSMLNPALGGDIAGSGKEPMGTIVGKVIGIDDERPRAATVVIEGEGLKLEIPTDPKGHFRTTIPTGVYTAYVKPTGKIDQGVLHAPFHVPPGRRVDIEIDGSTQYVYCSISGERVVPLLATDSQEDNMKGLQALKYDSFLVKNSDGPSLKIVIEYCAKTPAPDKSILYKAARMEYENTSIFVDSAVFDPRNPQKLTLSSRGGSVEVAQPGLRKEAPFVFASVYEGNLTLDYTDITSIKGFGEIESGNSSFNFKIDGNSIPRFHYTDKRKGLTLVSRSHEPLSITTGPDGSVIFGGFASVTRNSSWGDTSSERIVEYKVTVRDFGPEHRNKDRFLIDIPKENYRERGKLSKGDIEIGPPKAEGQGVAKFRSH